jgi:1-acyl-sn-glycerol-3-phosphate acyltransferase
MDVIPYKICYIAMRDIYKFGWLRWLLHLTRTLPSGSASIKAINLLENNRNVGIFPEGGISRDGRLKEFRRGAALLALKTGRPIVPCAILGTFEALPYGKRFPKPVPLELKIGKPIFLLKELSDIIDDVQLREGTFRIRQAVKELLNA